MRDMRESEGVDLIVLNNINLANKGVYLKSFCWPYKYNNIWCRNLRR